MKQVKENNWDIDLEFGHAWESVIIGVFSSKEKSCEVKAERGLWERTGNFVIEIRYDDKPSGISTTNAHWWCHCFIKDNGEFSFAILFTVENLRNIIKKRHEKGWLRTAMGGDGMRSELAIIPISEADMGKAWWK